MQQRINPTRNPAYAAAGSLVAFALSACVHSPAPVSFATGQQPLKNGPVSKDQKTQRDHGVTNVSGRDSTPWFKLSNVVVPTVEYVFLHKTGVIAMTPGVLPQRRGWVPKADFLQRAEFASEGIMFKDLPGADLHPDDVLVHPDGGFYLNIRTADKEKEEEEHNVWVSAYTQKGEPDPTFGTRIKQFPVPRMSGILFRVGKRVVRLQAKALQVNPVHPGEGGILLAGWYEDPRYEDPYEDPALAGKHKQKNFDKLVKQRRKQKRFTVLVLRRFHMNGKPDLRFGKQGVVVIDRREKPDGAEITGLQATANEIYVSYSLNRYRSDGCEEYEDPEDNIVVSYTNRGQLRDGASGPAFGQQGRVHLRGPTQQPISVGSFRLQQDSLLFVGSYHQEGAEQCGKEKTASSSERIIWWSYATDGKPTASFGKNGSAIAAFPQKPWMSITHLVNHEGRLYTVLEAHQDHEPQQALTEREYADQREPRVHSAGKTLVVLCRDQQGSPCREWGPEGRRDIPFHHLESIDDAHVYGKGADLNHYTGDKKTELWILVTRLDGLFNHAPSTTKAVLRLPLDPTE